MKEINEKDFSGGVDPAETSCRKCIPKVLGKNQTHATSQIPKEGYFQLYISKYEKPVG